MFSPLQHAFISCGLLSARLLRWELLQQTEAQRRGLQMRRGQDPDDGEAQPPGDGAWKA